MIQFNRYKLPDETHDFHGAFVNLVNTLATEINGDCHRSIGLLMSLAERFPHNDRIPAVAARMYFWGKVSWSTVERMMPSSLPTGFFYKQELVGCLGFEHSARQWGINEDFWNMYQGFSKDWYFDPPLATEKVIYQPRNSGFFSVIENIIAAQIVVELQGKELLVDLDGNWWGYLEPFEELFHSTFNFTRSSKSNILPKVEFEHMRHTLLNADDSDIPYYAYAKHCAYTNIYDDIASYMPIRTHVDSAGLMFVRGGDKLQTETILPPMKFLLRDLKWMARRCNERLVVSDDPRIGEMVSSLDVNVINKSNKLEGGYQHHFGRKVSCNHILENYLLMTEAKENLSCPSANLVNAAQWSRLDKENYSFANPVYRYLLI